MKLLSIEKKSSRLFPHSWLITGLVTRLTRRVSLVEQELLTFPEHLCSPPVFSGVRDTRFLVLLYVCFVDRCLSSCTFSFGHCVVFSSSIYGFWLPFWYLQTLLKRCEIKYCKLKDRKYNGQKKKTTGQTMVDKTTEKNIDWAYWTTIKNLGCYRGVRNSCYTNKNRYVTLTENLMINHQRETKDGIVTTAYGTYLWSPVTEILCYG